LLTGLNPCSAPSFLVAYPIMDVYYYYGTTVLLLVRSLYSSTSSTGSSTMVLQ